jgi:hypothetical protein
MWCLYTQKPWKRQNTNSKQALAYQTNSFRTAKPSLYMAPGKELAIHPPYGALLFPFLLMPSR